MYDACMPTTRKPRVKPGTKHIGVALPTELHEEISAAATADLRSLSREVIVLLSLGLETRARLRME
jgi:hypothetical protein